MQLSKNNHSCNTFSVNKFYEKGPYSNVFSSNTEKYLRFPYINIMNFFPHLGRVSKENKHH